MTFVVDQRMTWYLARASGLVAWGVLTASVVWGLLLSTRLIRRRGVSPWLLDLHRHLGVLAVLFTAVHLLALWADSFVHFGPAELFVPGASVWRPWAVAAGIVALYVLALVQVTSWLRPRLSWRLWHSVHLLSLPLFVLATAHGVLAGTDRTHRMVQWVGVTGITLVVFLVVFRTLARRAPSRPGPEAVVAPAEAVPAAPVG